MPTYGTPSIALSHGEGLQVWDEDGKQYLDLLAGIAVNALGHAHPAIVEAVSAQVQQLSHTSNLYANRVNLQLAEEVLTLFGDHGTTGKVFFCNSGAEANEAALKISRLTKRTKVVSALAAFHGRTFGALSLTAQPAKQLPFAPLVETVVSIPFGDADALAAAVDDETAAVFLEPILGESGVIVPPDGYLRAAREITNAHGALLVLDEIQTGIGRTGLWFDHQREGIAPDVVTLAKGLGGGLPIGACVAFGEAATLMQPGYHGTTFGGNAISAAAGLAVLSTIKSEGLLQRCVEAGERLRKGISDLNHPVITDVRGRGLLIGVGIANGMAPAIQKSAQTHGYLINATGPDTIRLAPPLIIEDADIDQFVADLPAITDAISSS